ncbi:hypothetical protein ACGFIR_06585 [Micromonospora sp. NPDC049051]|uniref:hypothetical protein n=1 Tax=Micromonospora sp. NPDC049051 TaxID=3364264 RepID=UPI0037199D26
MGDGLDDLRNYVLGTTAEAALDEFAGGRGATWRMSLNAKRHRGRGGAHLVRVVVTGARGHDAEELYVKVLPDQRSAEETARHRAAIDADPEFAERHLVRQPYPRYPVGDGRFLMFQDVARGAEHVLSLAEVPDAQLVEAYRTLVHRFLNVWCRREQRTSRTTVHEFVWRELDDAGAWREVLESVRTLALVDPDADWFRVAGHDQPLPNPLRLAASNSPLGDAELDQRCGASHGDPHRDSVLYPATRQSLVRVDEFCLVDLPRFATNAPLTRDLVILLLDAVLPEVAEGLVGVRADALRALLIDPAPEPSGWLPLLLTEVIRSCYAVGTTYAQDGSWRAQYLLSLVSQALISCTYENAGPVGRAWYFRLAAEAAEAYRREFQDQVAPPQQVPVPAAPVPGARGHDVSSGPTGPDGGGSGPIDATARRPHPPARPATPDTAWPEHPGLPGDPAPPVWTYGVVPIPEWQTSGSAQHGRHGAATDLRLPHEWSGAAEFHGHVPATREPLVTITDHRGDAARAAGPRHARRDPARTLRGAPPPPPGRTAVEADGIPRPRRPLAPDSVAPRPTRRRTRSLWPSARALKAVLIGGVSLVSVVVGGVAVLVVRDEPVTGLYRRAVAPSAGDASAQLAALALTVAARPSPAAKGPYTSICLRVWSPPANLASGVDLDSHHDEQLWWTSKRSGRRVVTPVVAGQRSEPQESRYQEGELTEIPPEPSADPAELSEQLSAQLDELPPELRNAAGLMELISRYHRYHLLDPGQHSVMLHKLGTTPGITARGSYLDWADRPGLAYSTDDGQGRRVTLQFDRNSGELLSHQTTSVAENLTLSYLLFLANTRTDSSTGARCG